MFDSVVIPSLISKDIFQQNNADVPEFIVDSNLGLICPVLNIVVSSSFPRFIHTPFA
jgi:hypothetical protein